MKITDKPLEGVLSEIWENRISEVVIHYGLLKNLKGLLYEAFAGKIPIPQSWRYYLLRQWTYETKHYTTLRLDDGTELLFTWTVRRSDDPRLASLVQPNIDKVADIPSGRRIRVKSYFVVDHDHFGRRPEHYASEWRGGRE